MQLEPMASSASVRLSRDLCRHLTSSPVVAALHPLEIKTFAVKWFDHHKVY
jgi:oligoribonuclease NrnB/cAMP/cGMP phosphodiesterase (DHH superfamily)